MAAYVLHDVYFPSGTCGKLQRGSVVLDETGQAHVVHVDSHAALDSLHEVHCHGKFIVLPALRNAYVEVPKSLGDSAPAVKDSHTNGFAPKQETQRAAVRVLLENSIKSGITEVTVHAPGLTAEELASASNAVPHVKVNTVDKRPDGVICVREDLFKGEDTIPLEQLNTAQLGSGSIAETTASMWDEMRSLILLKLERNGKANGTVALTGASHSGKWSIENATDLVVLYADETWAALGNYDLRGILLRVTASDVSAVFVQSKLVHKHQIFGERIRTVNANAGQIAEGKHAKNKNPDDVPDTSVAALGGGSDCEFDSIEEAIADFKAGKFVVVVDNEDRENEGDLILAAEHMTAEKMAFMIRFCSGLICLSALPSRLVELDLPLMVTANNESFKTAFTVSIDYIPGTTTGISAADRAATARAVADPTAKPEDFARPGHMFPLRYAVGGTLVRMGHTEATVDLCKLAGIYPVGVLCEIALDDGTMARRDYLRKFSRHHGLKMITIADIIRYRRSHSLTGTDF